MRTMNFFKERLVGYILPVVLVASSIIFVTTNVYGQVNVSLNNANRFQTIEGFGTCMGSNAGQATTAFQNMYAQDMGCSFLRMELEPHVIYKQKSSMDSCSMNLSIPANSTVTIKRDAGDVGTCEFDWIKFDNAFFEAEDCNLLPNTEVGFRNGDSDYFNGAQVASCKDPSNPWVARFVYMGHDQIFGHGFTIPVPVSASKIYYHVRCAGESVGGTMSLYVNGNFRCKINIPFTQGYNGGIVPDMIKPVRFGANINDNVNLFDLDCTWEKDYWVTAKAVNEKKLDQFKWIGSLWSPPHFMKTGAWIPWNGCSTNGGSLIQTADNLQQFSRYVAAYLKALYLKAGFWPYAISIQNELEFSEPYNSCVYDANTNVYANTLKAVGAELQANNIPTLLYGTETMLAMLGSNKSFINSVNADPVAKSYMHHYAVHGYAPDGITSGNCSSQTWKDYLDFIKPDNKVSWQTETSGEDFHWRHKTNGTEDGAFTVAREIQDALVSGNVTAWVYWQMMGDSSSVAFPIPQSLTTGTNTNNAKAKKYEAAKHFFRYIRPGSVRIDAGIDNTVNISVSAFVHDINHKLTMVLINTDTINSQTVNIAMPAGMTVNSFNAYRTSATDDFITLSDISVTNGYAILALPALSVVTINGSIVTSGQTIAITGVNLSQNTVTMTGLTKQLSALVLPGNASNNIVTWSSSDSTVATVSSTGLVTSKGIGNAYITVTTADQGKTATCNVIVNGSTLFAMATWDFKGNLQTTAILPANVKASFLSSATTGMGSSFVETNNGYFPNSIMVYGDTAKTLTGALAGNQYLSFNVTPSTGKSFTISKVAYRPFSQYTNQHFALFSSVKGFTAGNEIDTFTVKGSGSQPIHIVNISDNNNKTSAVEFRLYVYWDKNAKAEFWGGFGLGLRSSNLIENDIFIEGYNNDNIPPTVPTGLVSSNVQTTSFTLSWTASTDNVGIASYEVFENANSIGATTSTSYNVTGLSEATKYTMAVIAKDFAGNMSGESVPLEVNTASVVNDVLKVNSNEFSMYPNPAKDLLNVSFKNTGGKTIVTIFDLTGNVMYKKELTAVSNLTISTNSFGKGMYIVNVQSCSKIVNSKLIVK